MAPDDVLFVKCITLKLNQTRHPVAFAEKTVPPKVNVLLKALTLRDRLSLEGVSKGDFMLVYPKQHVKSLLHYSSGP